MNKKCLDTKEMSKQELEDVFNQDKYLDRMAKKYQLTDGQKDEFLRLCQTPSSIILNKINVIKESYYTKCDMSKMDIPLEIERQKSIYAAHEGFLNKNHPSFTNEICHRVMGASIINLEYLESQILQIQ